MQAPCISCSTRAIIRGRDWVPQARPCANVCAKCSFQLLRRPLQIVRLFNKLSHGAPSDPISISANLQPCRGQERPFCQRLLIHLRMSESLIADSLSTVRVGTTTQSVVRDHLRTVGENGPSFFVGNLDAVVEKLDEWNTQLPFVKPFYGSSINDPLVHAYELHLTADNLLSC
ncbi:uncharacterized protein BO97DRAFT_46617 [Aspergillus homomorphus CBS 101889]|uniref:Uncharacterized protein n=1 Tax=Aspergillus homomorphus (strain CBS 101889) TaxID=1450537 RepID=A0A395HFF6_ASPHC|nr:hypothetical protein BO97DRAFT_46617 [Aspergillus homomorphus CBS 101889]RAL06460.1 hypothetical protein BO97DRAFT_46617 [Aspergillus homomorphus CBS 101889]